MPAINPYLTFDDNCEEVFKFYKAAFGGEFAMVMRFENMPEQQQNKAEAKKIMHIALPIGKGTVLMGSDTPDSMGKTVRGTNFSISISADSKSIQFPPDPLSNANFPEAFLIHRRFQLLYFLDVLLHAAHPG